MPLKKSLDWNGEKFWENLLFKKDLKESQKSKIKNQKSKEEKKEINSVLITVDIKNAKEHKSAQNAKVASQNWLSNHNKTTNSYQHNNSNYKNLDFGF